MGKAILGIVVLLASCIVASAQQSGSYVYAVTGPVVVPRSAFTRWDGNFVHVGGGGEARARLDSVAPSRRERAGEGRRDQPA
jgi:hypothetical protein